MRNFHLLFAVLIGVACFAQDVSADSVRTPAERYAAAKAAYRAGRMTEAYGRFVALANLGHAPSAEIALFMYEHGPDLFGKEWDLAPYQLENWPLASRGECGTEDAIDLRVKRARAQPLSR